MAHHERDVVAKPLQSCTKVLLGRLGWWMVCSLACMFGLPRCPPPSSWSDPVVAQGRAPSGASCAVDIFIVDVPHASSALSTHVETATWKRYCVSLDYPLSVLDGLGYLADVGQLLTSLVPPGLMQKKNSSRTRQQL